MCGPGRPSKPSKMSGEHREQYLASLKAKGDVCKVQQQCKAAKNMQSKYIGGISRTFECATLTWGQIVKLGLSTSACS